MKTRSELFLFICLLLLPIFSFGQYDTVEVVILHTNDTHSKINEFSKIAYLVDDFRSKHENVLLVSAGDLFTGNPIVDHYEIPGYPIIDLMNKLNYDLSCIGNHEFDYGQKILTQLIDSADFAPMPGIRSNSWRSARLISIGLLRKLA